MLPQEVTVYQARDLCRHLFIRSGAAVRILVGSCRRDLKCCSAGPQALREASQASGLLLDLSRILPVLDSTPGSGTVQGTLNGALKRESLGCI